ncbi:MAG: hypothetical protein OXU20_02400 [Myxococcales bacterium]|nr:hypothetical protein [Myxococcales bacterium]MDD9967865.1 hypothetical protein [Myxococcales bacterium]
MGSDPIRDIDDIYAFGLGESELDLLARLAGPTWFSIAGRDPSRTRVVATLLHGSEPSGIRAVHTWLAAGITPAVNLAFYVGSVQAALLAPPFSHRMRPGARDANRCFLPPFDGDDGRLAEALLDRVAAVGPEALVDLHDNTGHSPAYGVGASDDAAHLRLVDLFADKYMLSDLQLGTLVEATDAVCPSVVIECGTAGSPLAQATALAGLDRFACTHDLGLAVGGRIPIDVLHAPVRVSVAPEAQLAFGEAPVGGADLTLRSGIDRHNFDSMPMGTPIGWLANGSSWPLAAHGAQRRDISRDLFGATTVDGRRILETRREIVPIMMTGRADIAKQDCLFYAMQRRRG